MSTRQPPWSAQGQVAVTLLPPTRASNSVTARLPPGPRSTAALRAGSRDPCIPRPARRSGLAGRMPGRPRIGPGRAEPFGPCPASPAQPYRPAPHERRTRQAATDPTRPQRPQPAGYREAEKSLPCLGGGNNASMVVLRRNGRRRAAGAEPMVRAFGETRTCAEDGCTARLSRYNPARSCAIHQGWDGQEVPRPRRRRP
jgi:hypothetical protein